MKSETLNIKSQTAKSLTKTNLAYRLACKKTICGSLKPADE